MTINMNDRFSVLEKWCFDRPLIIVAAPRSGSTMLFETLIQAPGLWSIGKESHAIFEQIPQLNPATGLCDSNFLSKTHATQAVDKHIKHSFLRQAIDRSQKALVSNRMEMTIPEPIRFIEKTPKNSLRIDFLNSLFPDANYVYLYRDVKQNLSSMIEAWRSNFFVTYKKLPNWTGRWSLMLPPEYYRLKGCSLATIVSYQWFIANNTIINDLQELPRERVLISSYDEIINNTEGEIARLCKWASISCDDHLRHYCKHLPLSKTTLTAPGKDKWKKNAAMIEKVLPLLAETLARIQFFKATRSKSLQLSAENFFKQLAATEPLTKNKEEADKNQNISRNSRCYCGSGKRYKHCHGNLYY